MSQQKPLKGDGMDVLFDALITGDSGGAIERQEANGQKSFVSSTTLPTNLNGGKAMLETAGVKFLDVVPGDPMFQYVELPDGWKKVATDHPMWSDLVDEKGRKRASIFYKAAFYDRSARLSLSRRFSVQFDYDRFDDEKVAVATATDGDGVAFTTEPIHFVDDKTGREAKDRARALATAWLNEKYPNWENAAAYWD